MTDVSKTKVQHIVIEVAPARPIVDGHDQVGLVLDYLETSDVLGESMAAKTIDFGDQDLGAYLGSAFRHASSGEKRARASW